MMCLIVDANVASLVFTDPPDPEFAPVWNSLRRRRTVAFYGGKLAEEYHRLTSLRGLIQELDRQGFLHQVDGERVREATEKYARLPLQSDDPHILGLARVARVRLLCSHDQDLHADFTNRRLLRPAGQVYQNTTHQHLLRKHCRRLKRRSRGGRGRGK